MSTDSTSTTSLTTVPTRAVRRRRKLLKRSGKDLLIATLLGNPLLSQKKVAEIAEVKPSRVSSVNSKIQSAADLSKSVKAAWQYLLLDKFPLQDRIDRLLEIARDMVVNDRNAKAVLQALEMVQGIDGIAARSQPSEEGQIGGYQPAFVLPPGTRVSIQVEGMQQEPVKPVTIDVTPEIGE